MGDYAALDAQIDAMMFALGSGVWKCRGCDLHCKKGDMRRHVEAKETRETIKVEFTKKNIFGSKDQVAMQKIRYLCVVIFFHLILWFCLSSSFSRF